MMLRTGPQKYFCHHKQRHLLSKLSLILHFIYGRRITWWPHLQTLGGALIGPSADEAGGSAGGRHKPWCASKSGAGAAIFGKGWDPIVGRCVVGAGGRVGPESGGREVSPVGPFLGVAGAGCLWSSLPRL